jgi:hypothetical protein
MALWSGSSHPSLGTYYSAGYCHAAAADNNNKHSSSATHFSSRTAALDALTRNTSSRETNSVHNSFSLPSPLLLLKSTFSGAMDVKSITHYLHALDMNWLSNCTLKTECDDFLDKIYNNI